MESDTFRTHVGLTYFRQVRDGKHLKDDQLLALYKLIRNIETEANHPYHSGSFMRSAGWREYARAPFDALPCHRALMIEVQGEEWVLEREKEAELKKIEEAAKEAKWAAEREAEKKKREAKIQRLRDL